MSLILIRGKNDSKCKSKDAAPQEQEACLNTYATYREVVVSVGHEGEVEKASNVEGKQWRRPRREAVTADVGSGRVRGRRGRSETEGAMDG